MRWVRAIPGCDGAPAWLARSRRIALAVALAVGLIGSAPTSAQERRAVIVADIKGAIGVATAEFVEQTIEDAATSGAVLVVFRIDTPGGLVTSTRDIIQKILAAPLPIAVYVAPGGARAASAGTYIVYAAHVAAMAPATNLGAATPVRLGGPPGTPGGERPRERGRDDGKNGGDGPAADDASALDRKALNDAVAFLRSLAQLRGRNVEWAEKAVVSAATLTAEDAVRENVVDLVASDVKDLLAKIDGRKVVADGRERALATKDAQVVESHPDWRSRIIAAMTDPTVAYFLLIIGIYGIIFEFWNPGFVLPGVLGGVCLLLALAALSVLPVDYAGLALIILGVAFMVAEAFTPGIGALGIGGLIAFVAGSIFLYNPRGADIEIAVSWPAIVVASAVSALFMFGVLGFAMRARKAAVVTGVEEMLGSEARVLDWQGERGHVRAHGEIWRARADRALEPGATVRVRQVDGLTLVVEPGDPA